MSGDTVFLISILYESSMSILKIAFKLNTDDIPDDILNYPMEFESRKFLQERLPKHLSILGPIVNVEFIEYLYIENKQD